MISTKFRSRTETPRPISMAISQKNELSMNELTKSNDRTSQTMRAIYKDLRTEGAIEIRPLSTKDARQSTEGYPTMVDLS